MTSVSATGTGLVSGVGLGLRRALLGPLSCHDSPDIDFLEIAPENWMRVGGRMGRQFRALTEKYPFVCHGLSLSLGGMTPLDESFLRELKSFLADHHILGYSEHLSFCGDEGHLYDLMPIPFTDEAIRYVAGRIRVAQDVLEQRIAIENISYYAAPGQGMDELDFLLGVLDEADCDLLLDVNNVYVNSVNHQYDAEHFIKGLPRRRIKGIHIAGHYVEADDFLIDTHGAQIADPVWWLLDETYKHFGVIPTLLERDFNIPSLDELISELKDIRRLQRAYAPLDRKYG